METINEIAKLRNELTECVKQPQACAPLSTGLLYPKFQVQTSGIIQKLYETKTNTNTG